MDNRTIGRRAERWKNDEMNDWKRNIHLFGKMPLSEFLVSPMQESKLVDLWAIFLLQESIPWWEWLLSWPFPSDFQDILRKTLWYFPSDYQWRNCWQMLSMKIELQWPMRLLWFSLPWIHLVLPFPLPQSVASSDLRALRRAQFSLLCGFLSFLIRLGSSSRLLDSLVISCD